ncbi:hypothetical protein ACLB2K_068714 [Fragaria x ananassa]
MGASIKPAGRRTVDINVWEFESSDERLERKQPEKTLKEKLEKLTKANEELLEKNAQLLIKVKAADIHIK